MYTLPEAGKDVALATLRVVVPWIGAAVPWKILVEIFWKDVSVKVTAPEDGCSGTLGASSSAPIWSSATPEALVSPWALRMLNMSSDDLKSDCAAASMMDRSGEPGLILVSPYRDRNASIRSPTIWENERGTGIV